MTGLTKAQFEHEKTIRLQQRVAAMIAQLGKLLDEIGAIESSCADEAVLSYEEHEQLETAKSSLSHRHRSLQDEFSAPRRELDLKMSETVVKHHKEAIHTIAQRLAFEKPVTH